MGIIEIVSSIFMLISVILISFNKVQNYPLGIISCLGFAYLFFQTSLYGNFILQFIFIIISIYGWYNWNNNNDLKITWSKPKIRNILILSSIISIILLKLTTSLFLVDIVITILSLVATYLMAKRNIDHWIIWIIVDIASIYLYWKVGLYLLSIEYIIFVLNAVFGFYNWNKEKNEKSICNR